MSTVLFLSADFLAPLRVLSVGAITWMSTAPNLMSNRNIPRKSGDKGPEKNYQKKMAKKVNKNAIHQSNTSNGKIHALMKGLRNVEDSDYDPAQDKIQDVLSDMVHGIKGRFWQQQETLQETANSVPVPRSSRQMSRPINFMKPDSGSRLDIFDPTDDTVEVIPPGRPNLTEEDKQKQLEDIHLLQTTSYFQDLIDRRGVPYPRQFPVDNENYNHDESEVSFKDHVLLDNLIRNFPSRGPVRHFMELVVTGLSMNPDYSTTEKQDIIRWYKEYFDQFTQEELQAMPANNLPALDIKHTH